MKKWILSTLILAWNGAAMVAEKSSDSISLPTITVQETTTVAKTDVPEVYIPHNYDVTEDLNRGSRCCFNTSFWFIQPVAVASPLASSVLVAFGEYYINDNPNVAKILNGIGLGFSVAGFVASTLLIKINNKLKKIDAYIEGQVGN